MTIKDFINTILCFLVVILFCVNYPIAEYLANWDINPDKNLAIRFNIYSIVIGISAYLASQQLNILGRFMLSIFIGLCFNDIIDLFIFDVTVFSYNDIIIIILTVLTSYYRYVYVPRRS